MTDPLDGGFEENHALWWTIDGLREGQQRDGNPAYYWTFHPQQGWASLHKIRLNEDGAEAALNGLIAKCVPGKTAIHAHVSDLSTPKDMVRRMRKKGFQHARKYPIFYRCLDTALPTATEPVRFEAITDMTVFDRKMAHPETGIIDRPAAKKRMRELQNRISALPGKISHHVGWQEQRATCSFVLVRTGDLVGFYDPAFAEGCKTLANANAMIAAAMAIAKKEGFARMGLICDRELEGCVRQHGFVDSGFISWLYLSKTKLTALELGS